MKEEKPPRFIFWFSRFEWILIGEFIKIHSNPASTAIAAKRKAAYIEARDARRAARQASILALAILAEESDTDNEQDDEIYSPCVVSQNLPATNPTALALCDW